MRALGILQGFDRDSYRFEVDETGSIQVEETVMASADLYIQQHKVAIRLWRRRCRACWT